MAAQIPVADIALALGHVLDYIAEELPSRDGFAAPGIQALKDQASDAVVRIGHRG